MLRRTRMPVLIGASNDIEFSGEEEGAQRLTMSPLQ